MDCDIHAYIEQVYDNRTTWYWANPQIDRDYRLFAILAQVRWDLPENLTFKPKGMPSIETLSWQVSGAYYLTIDDEKAVDQDDDPEERYITRVYAEMYNRDYGLEIISRPNANDIINNPDYHDASFLNLEELIIAQANYAKVSTERNRDLDALVGAMQGLKDEKNIPRLVFWFDN